MEWYRTESGKYKIESLTAASFPGALRVIKEAFCQDEAVCRGTEIDKNPKATEELLELCADSALDGVSLVAVEIATGNVVAASFNKLQVSSSNSTERPFFEVFAEERCSQESSKSLIKFMFDVDSRCNLFEKYSVDCSLEIMFLATLREHRGHKLGTLLCQYSVELARKLQVGPVAKMTVADLGPSYANMPPRDPVTSRPRICQAIWTGTMTQRIGKTLNFTVHLTVPFTEFEHDGKTYADRIGEPGCFCEIAALVL